MPDLVRRDGLYARWAPSCRFNLAAAAMLNRDAEQLKFTGLRISTMRKDSGGDPQHLGTVFWTFLGGGNDLNR